MIKEEYEVIYFDNAATTYPKPQCVYEAIDIGMKQYSFNAGRGCYQASKNTFDMIQETRNKIASLVGEMGNKVIFTSSATESLNNILYGLNLTPNDCVFVSPFEHNAVIRTLHNIGVNIIVIPFNKDTWELSENELNDLYILKKPKATVISHISNVTGYELPYKKIFNVAKKYNSVNVLDCAQSFGIYPVEKTNIDFLIFAGHKSLYAMLGIAGYINLSDFSLSLYKVGGTGSDSLNPNMPNYVPAKYEAGSSNSVGIFSIKSSLEYLQTENFAEKECELVEYLLKGLYSIKKVLIYLPSKYISRGIVSFNLEGFNSDELGTILSEDYDICVRTGYHCAPYIHDFIDSVRFNGTVRVSLGIFNTKSEIGKFIYAIKEISS